MRSAGAGQKRGLRASLAGTPRPGGVDPALAPKDAGGNTLLVQNGYKPSGSTFQSTIGTGTRRTGQQGRCYLYDGTDDYSIMDSDLVLTGDFTLSWRINYTSGLVQHVFYDSSNNRIYAGSSTSLVVIANSTMSTIALDKTLVAGTDYNFTLKRESGVLTLYLDGVAQADTEANAQTLTLSSVSFATTALGAKIWDIRVYASTALTDSEITNITSYGKIGTAPATPTNWWKCDEQAGTIGYDSVGGNHLTHTNITASTFHATQTLYSFQNEVGYTQGKNYVKYSTDMSQSWSVTNITITDNQSDPDGGTAAQKLEVTTTATAALSQLAPLAAVNNGNHCFSFYVKAITGGTDGGAIYLRNNTTGINIAYANFDFSTSILTVSAGTGSATDVGDGWYLLQVYSDQISAGDTLRAYVGWPGGSHDAGEAIYVYAPQLEEGVTRTAYQPTGNYSLSSAIFIPRDESNTTQDVLGNTLQYTGKRPNDGALINSNCLTLNGTNQAVRVADNTDLDITDNLTVSVWAKNDLASLSATKYVIGKYDGGDNEREWGIAVNSSQQMLAVIGSSDGTSVTTQTTDAAITTDSFNHLAFSFASGTVKVYVNGIPVASTASASHPVTLNNETADLTIGSILSVDTPTNFWDGQVFDARIYKGDSTVLTDAEMLSIYENPEANINFTGQTLAAHYKCAEGAGTQCLDASGNANHGTIENAGSNWTTLQDAYHANINTGCGKRMYFDGVDDNIALGVGDPLGFNGASKIGVKFKIIPIKSPSSAEFIFVHYINLGLGGIAFGYNNSFQISAGGRSIASDPYQNAVSTNTISPSLLNTVEIYFDYQNDEIGMKVNDNDFETFPVSYSSSTYVNTNTTTNTFIASSGSLFGRGVLFDFEFYKNDVLVHSYSGYGNNTSDWIDQIGSVNGTVNGSPSAIYIPSDDATPANDVFGSTLTNPAVNGHNDAETDINFNPDSVPINANIVTTNDGDGSSYIEIPDNAAFDITDNLTVMCWAKNDSATLAGSENFFCKYDSGTNEREWLLQINTDEKFLAVIGNSTGSSNSIEKADTAIDPSDWHHYAFTFETGTVKLYIDGVEVDSTTTGTHVATLNNETSPVTIFSSLISGSATNVWNGSIEHCRIYSGDSTVLTAAQVLQCKEQSEKLLTFSGQTLVCAPELMSDTLDWSGNNLHGENNGITFTKYTVPTAYSFGDTLTATYNHFKREASSVKEDRFLLYRESLELNSKLSQVENYTA